MVRVVRRRLGAARRPMEVLRAFRGDERTVCLAGAWASGGVVIASAPVRVVSEDDDLFALLDEHHVIDGDGSAVGGGWFGAMRYPLGGRVERLPAARRRPVALPTFAMGYYDHLLRYDGATGDWWFEALWSPGRASVLDEREAEFARRVGGGVATSEPYAFDDWVITPDRAGHVAAVERALGRIAAGDVFQVNVCLRLESTWTGDPLDVFCDVWPRLRSPYAAFVAHDGGAIVSFSPELFLERRGRVVRSAPIKGTRPRPDDPRAAEDQRAALVASAKDHAENVMIVDVMRNDLGRVCEYGSVRAPALAQVEAHPGVWHLASEVTGVLRAGVGDGAVLRAAFPPASVTGAPKVRAMELIADLEATGREAYTGAIGYVSPCAGVELNVAIRTFEIAADRVWLGSGGGVVADSDPAAEFEECLTKANPLLHALGAARAEYRGGGVRNPPVRLGGDVRAVYRRVGAHGGVARPPAGFR